VNEDRSTVFFDAIDLEGLSAVERQFLVTTANGADDGGVSPLSKLLEAVQQHFGMDVVFVSEFVAGRRVFRHVCADEADISLISVGSSDPLEESYCQRVVDGRLPAVIPEAAALPEAAGLAVTAALRIGSYLSAPVLLQGGKVYGTLCCFSHAPKADLNDTHGRTLDSVAKVVAAAIERAGGGGEPRRRE
jgi:GAF domain-containing protein